MAKDPAFLFYSKDWLEGTAEFMPDEKGVYIDLLCHQHQKGDLPLELNRLAKICGISQDIFLKIWEQVGPKFEIINGRYKNKRLTKIVTERSDKGKKNKIIGTLASVVRLSKYSHNSKYLAKKTFNYEDFLTVEDHLLTESITEWFNVRLKSIENATANEDEDINRLGGTGGREEKNRFWFLRIHKMDYISYEKLFGKFSASEPHFFEWKKFVDWVYEKEFTSLFECKFITPFEFGKLIKLGFKEEEWEPVCKKILSTGIKPEHQLYFRIPQFLEYLTEKHGKQSDNFSDKSVGSASRKKIEALRNY